MLTRIPAGSQLSCLGWQRRSAPAAKPFAGKGSKRRQGPITKKDVNNG